ncbi:MAG TPA: NUDIX hydrolase [Candidatus Saccharimonadales bacterium]|nr:NUDIX hydrolase [Candidatus Saccharimonadales bacterium]
MPPTLRVAAKAVIVKNGKVLIVREANTYGDGTQLGRYGLPGGRLELGERFYDGLKREVHEEVGLEVEHLYPVFVGEWRPVIKDVPHQIIAVFVVCEAKSNTLTLSDEHDDAQWIDPALRHQFDLMDPDWEVIDAYAARLA